MLVSLCGLLRAAQFGDFTYQDFGNYVAITDYPTNGSGALTIPATINGKPVKRIAFGAFSNCGGLTAVTLPSSITHIEDKAFAYCGLLATINFPSGLVFIGSEAFIYCRSLTTVALPSSLTALGRTVFSRCAALASISVSASNPAFMSEGEVLFNKSKTVLIQFPSAKSGVYTVPSTVTGIGEEAFFGAFDLTGIKFPSGLTVISNSAFYGCQNLTQINLPGNLKSIGLGAFSRSGITSVLLPSSVTSVGNSAFSYCDSLTQAWIPESVSSLGAGAFMDCGVLTSISVSPSNPHFEAKDGVVFNESGSTLVLFPSGRAGYYAVPYGVTSIGDYAFSGSRKLSAVSLPVGLQSIGHGGFVLCTGLQSVELPVGLASIGPSAFWSCSSLTEIFIPASVSSVQYYSFYGCGKLTHATFRGNAPIMGSVVFASTPAAFEVRHYQDKTGFDAPYWQSFKLVNLGNLTELPEDIIVHGADGGEYSSGVDSENFGVALSGQSVTRVFTVRNAGELPLTGLMAGREGPNAADFIVSQPGTTTVPPGGFTTFNVTFQPKTGGNKQAVLRISSSDPNDDPFEIGLIGQVMVPVPEIVVMQPAGSSLIDGKAKRSFGTVKVGSKGTAKTFTIRNTGTARLSGLSVLKSGSHKGDFIVGALPRTTLDPGSSLTFKITFKAKAKGTRNAAIQIRSNDANENPFDFKVAGLGTLP